MKKLLICIICILLIGSLASSSYSSDIASKYDKNVKIKSIPININDQDNISIIYPEINGLNKREEKLINALIKNNIYEIVVRKEEDMYEGYNLLFSLDYKIAHISDEFISICYTGYSSPLNSGRGYTDEFYTINIDAAQGKIVDKKDAFKDENQIFNLLMQDKFESITEKEGIKGKYLFSDLVNDFHLIEPKEGLESPDLKYFIDGNNLVFAVLDTSGVYEYTIEISKIKNFFNSDILDKIQMKELNTIAN